MFQIQSKSGWLDNDGQIRHLKDGRIIWISENSGFKHVWMAKHSGSRSWPITEGKWEATKLIHVDEKQEVIYFIGNKNFTLKYALKFVINKNKKVYNK